MADGEEVPAFAAYNKKGTNAKAKNAKAGNSRGVAAKGKGAVKGKAAAASTKGKNAKAAAMAFNGKINNHRGGAAKTAAAKNKAKTARRFSLPIAKNTTVKAPKAGNTRRKSTSTNGIDDGNIDALVEQLLGDSGKVLSKADKQKQKELQDYLVKKMEMDSTVDGSFTDEYTLSGSDSSDFSGSSGSDSESESGCSDSSSSGSGSGSSSGSSCTAGDTGLSSFGTTRCGTDASTLSAEETHLQALRDAVVPTKRKSAPAKTTTQNGPSAPKSSRNSVGAAVPKKSAPTTKQRASLVNSTPKDKPKSCPRNPDAQKMKLEPPSPATSTVKMDSVSEGMKLFSWLLNPVTLTDFFGKNWEKNCCLIKRNQAKYYANLISFAAIDEMLLNNHVEFTKNIDVTSYKKGVRETLNPEGRALPPLVWDHYSQGCSIRLLNPQTFLPALFSLNTNLQEFFHCMVGANAYLTPPNSQGFAPHYDDIEAFVLQIEGRKRWKLYKGRNSSEHLPRYSSKNFTQEEIGQPILDEVLSPGDILYFPRGTIHQACTEPGYHSLHITLSVYQKQSYADFLERLVPLMLQSSIANVIDFRRGLPLEIFRHAGCAYSDTNSPQRIEFVKKTASLLKKCLNDMPLEEFVDAAIDQVAKKFQHEALPPQILPAERPRTVFGSRTRTNAKGEVVCSYDINSRTNVRLLRAHIMRLVEEEQKTRIYYYLENSKEYCEYEPNFMEIEASEAASIKMLIKSYPNYVSVSKLPLTNQERKIDLVSALWERGLLMTEKPFTGKDKQ